MHAIVRKRQLYTEGYEGHSTILFKEDMTEKCNIPEI